MNRRYGCPTCKALHAGKSLITETGILQGFWTLISSGSFLQKVTSPFEFEFGTFGEADFMASAGLHEIGSDGAEEMDAAGGNGFKSVK